MNYIEEINKFQVWISLHPDVSTSARILWFALMHYDNVSGWKETFSVAMSSLMEKTGLGKQAIVRARRVLQENGRINYVARKGNQATMYQILSFSGEPIVTTGFSEEANASRTQLPPSTEMGVIDPQAVNKTLADQKSLNQTSNDRKSVNQTSVNQQATCNASDDKVGHTSNAVADDIPNAVAGGIFDHTSSEVESNTPGDVFGNIPRDVPGNLPCDVFGNSPCDVPSHSPSGTQTDTQTDTHADTILKQNKTKQNNRKENLSKKGDPVELIDEAGCTPPSLEMVQAYCLARGNTVDPKQFVDYYQRRDWFVGQTKMKNWKAVVRSWERRQIVKKQTASPNEQTSSLNEQMPPKKYVYIDAGDGSYVDAEGLPIMFEYH